MTEREQANAERSYGSGCIVASSLSLIGMQSRIQLIRLEFEVTIDGVNALYQEQASQEQRDSVLQKQPSGDFSRERDRGQDKSGHEQDFQRPPAIHSKLPIPTDSAKETPNPMVTHLAAILTRMADARYRRTRKQITA